MKQPIRSIALVLVVGALTLGAPLQAQTVGKTQQTRTQEASTQSSYSTMDDRDRLLGQIWGLSNEEMIRAKVLLKGPRAAFSVENLSPVEALGIHARDEKERVKYAEMFARALQADVERSLAWNNTFTAVQARLFPNQAVLDFSGQSSVAVPTAAADMMGVPRTLVHDPAATVRKPATANKR